MAWLLTFPLLAAVAYVYAQRNVDSPTDSSRDRLLPIPVPWVYVLVYLAGALVGHLAPPLPLHVLAGVAILAAGLYLASAAQWLFRSAQTTTVPFHAPTTLITDGPYRWTRNPMYVGLALVYAGVAVMNDHAWSLLLLPAVLFYVDRYVIPLEEENLRTAFGASYDEYASRVRRWC